MSAFRPVPLVRHAVDVLLNELRRRGRPQLEELRSLSLSFDRILGEHLFALLHSTVVLLGPLQEDVGRVRELLVFLAAVAVLLAGAVGFIIIVERRVIIRGD